VRKPYPREFRDDVVRVARSRDSKTPLEQIAKDFGVHQTTLNSWMRQAVRLPRDSVCRDYPSTLALGVQPRASARFRASSASRPEAACW
jgi:hypothetical protein